MREEFSTWVLVVGQEAGLVLVRQEAGLKSALGCEPQDPTHGLQMHLDWRGLAGHREEKDSPGIRERDVPVLMGQPDCKGKEPESYQPLESVQVEKRETLSRSEEEGHPQRS